MLYPGGAQAGHSFTLDGALPRCQFLESEAVAVASLGDRQEPSVDRSYDFRLTANYPARRVAWRKAALVERFTQGSDDGLRPV
ncbi:hypothetical protein ADT71_22040 [Novosphingobium sp. ST904]|nr:hypothetical protein ADT71_22040 [Novosphingobium sp. ST904]